MQADARERDVLRELAARAVEAAATEQMAARRRRWQRHNDLESTYPIIWVSPEGSWRELLPDDKLICQQSPARAIEAHLRRVLHAWEHFHDDSIVEGHVNCGPAVKSTGWGLSEQWHESSQATGAKGFSPQIHTRDDLAKLKFPTVSCDHASSAANLARQQELLGEVMPVRPRGVRGVSFHLMRLYIGLRGLQQMMEDMYDQPEMLHEAMALFEEGSRRLVQQYVDLNLLDVNNDDTYHSSGGKGFSNQLPADGFDPARVRPADMWASAEAQELALVSPQMHEEFSLQYERRLLAPFGLNGYGCCEDLTAKLDYVLAIPNIRRISISPWADVQACAEKIGDRCIFSWKPHPAHVTSPFNPDAIRSYIRRTIEITRANGCFLEMILKDTHTCESRPERFTIWTQIARQEVERAYGAGE